jgi:hypothetical protein
MMNRMFGFCCATAGDAAINASKAAATKLEKAFRMFMFLILIDETKSGSLHATAARLLQPTVTG